MGVPTQDEIVARVYERVSKDFLGIETEDLVWWLDFDHARQFINADVTREEWERGKTLTRENIVAKMLDYMPFAWGANGFRDISLWRSIVHFVTWTWLAGDRDLSAYCEDKNNHENRGKKILIRICEHYGWDASQWDASDAESPLAPSREDSRRVEQLSVKALIRARIALELYGSHRECASRKDWKEPCDCGLSVEIDRITEAISTIDGGIPKKEGHGHD
jgi:hypothetical protein